MDSTVWSVGSGEVIFDFSEECAFPDFSNLSEDPRKNYVPRVRPWNFEKIRTETQQFFPQEEHTSCLGI